MRSRRDYKSSQLITAANYNYLLKKHVVFDKLRRGHNLTFKEYDILKTISKHSDSIFLKQFTEKYHSEIQNAIQKNQSNLKYDAKIITEAHRAYAHLNEIKSNHHSPQLHLLDKIRRDRPLNNDEIEMIIKSETLVNFSEAQLSQIKK